jgi:hypothetical protein
VVRGVKVSRCDFEREGKGKEVVDEWGKFAAASDGERAVLEGH